MKGKMVTGKHPSVLPSTIVSYFMFILALILAPFSFSSTNEKCSQVQVKYVKNRREKKPKTPRMSLALEAAPPTPTPPPQLQLQQQQQPPVSDLETFYRDYIDDPSCALLVVDLQKGDTDKNHLPNVPQCFHDRISKLVFPNVKWLQKEFRKSALERGGFSRVVHLMVRPGAVITDSHQRCTQGKHRHHDSFEIVQDVAPLADELVVEKTTCSGFSSTNLERQLRWMGIKKLLVVGVVTQNCVLSTVMNAYDLGFDVAVVEDAVASHDEQLHQCALEIMRARFATMVSVSGFRGD